MAKYSGDRLVGRVESLNRKRDAPRDTKPTFGFLIDGNGQSYFFLPNGMSPESDLTFDELRTGLVVTFEVTPHPKGPRATNVACMTAGMERLS